MFRFILFKFSWFSLDVLSSLYYFFCSVSQALRYLHMYPYLLLHHILIREAPDLLYLLLQVQLDRHQDLYRLFRTDVVNSLDIARKHLINVYDLLPQLFVVSLRVLVSPLLLQLTNLIAHILQ